jgi:hypothetical protein
MTSTSADVWKLPPRIKIYEALGSIADGRVHLLSDSEAVVVSSDGTRRYHVRWKDNAIVSDDNGSKYKGYLGYPAIAVLMLRGILPYDESVAQQLKGIPWKELNERFGRYDKTERYVLEHVRDPERVKAFVERVYNELKRLRPHRLRGVQSTLF